MTKKNSIVSIPFLVVVIAITGYIVWLNGSNFDWGLLSRDTVPSGTSTTSTVSGVYRIVQAEGAWPRILEAKIDPPDVHVGDTQTLSLVVQDTAEITEVIAKIETDNGIVTLPLKFVGPVADKDVTPERYGVDSSGALIALTPSPVRTGIAKAAEPEKLKYEGSWIVRDTHDTTYRTIFTVKDSLNRENSITMAWSDACSIPMGGSWTIGSNCTISSTDGVDAGDATIANGYTLVLNAAFAYGPNNTVYLMTSGTIAIGAGGLLFESNLYLTDADGDDYPLSFANYSDATVGKRRRYLMNDTLDCNDNRGDLYVRMSNMYRFGVGPSTICTGAWRQYVLAGPLGMTAIYCYYNDAACTYSWKSGASQPYCLGESTC